MPPRRFAVVVGQDGFAITVLPEEEIPLVHLLALTADQVADLLAHRARVRAGPKAEVIPVPEDERRRRSETRP